MNTILIPVRTDRLPTPYDVQRAICNRQEQLERRLYEYPEMTTPIPSWKTKSYGLFRSIERWGMWA
jgi:hypothetical protein